MKNDFTQLYEGVYLGVSLGVPFFTKERIENYLAWAAVNTRRFAILLGDEIFAYTLAIFKDIEISLARERAKKIGDEMTSWIMKARSRIPFQLFRWKDIREVHSFSSLNTIVRNEYDINEEFSHEVRNQAFKNIGPKIESVIERKSEGSKKRVYTLLDSYIIDEISGLITMSEYCGFPSEIYPGSDLQIMNKIYNKKFPKIFSLIPKPPKREFLNLRLE